jgi:hypothetical protein
VRVVTFVSMSIQGSEQGAEPGSGVQGSALNKHTLCLEKQHVSRVVRVEKKRWPVNQPMTGQLVSWETESKPRLGEEDCLDKETAMADSGGNDSGGEV